MADNPAPVIDANTAAIDMPSYQQSGFGQSTGANLLQNEVSNFPTDQASVQKQAQTQYQQTYDIQQKSLQTQLSSLIKAQADDSDLLNRQYEQSINTMMSKLNKRGLSIGATPQATTAALNRFRNDVMTQRQNLYSVQQGGIRAAQDSLRTNYNLNIQARAYDIQNNSLRSLTQILTQMAQLQSSSYEEYINYLLSRKKTGMDMESANIARQNLEMDAQSNELDRKRILLDAESLGIARDKIGLESQSIGLDTEKIGLEKESIEIDRKLLELKDKKSKSSGSSRRRYSAGSGGSSIPGSKEQNQSSLPNSYFSGDSSSTNRKWVGTPGGKWVAQTK